VKSSANPTKLFLFVYADFIATQIDFSLKQFFYHLHLIPKLNNDNRKTGKNWNGAWLSLEVIEMC